MRISRVFCYSQEVARQNGNKLPIAQLVISIVVFLVAVIILSFVLVFAGMPVTTCLTVVLLVSAVFLGIIIYFAIILGLRMRAQMTGWAVTDDQRVFMVRAISNSRGVYLGGGIALGSMFDQVAKTGNRLGRSMGSLVGSAAEFYSMNKTAEYMTHPEIVAKMAESAPNITGAEVTEILRVYSMVNDNHSVKVQCDYKNMRNGKVKTGRNLTIEKSYNNFNELINLISLHR